MFFAGFLISPAMNVTLFQASLLNTEPTMAAAMPPMRAAPAMGVTVNPAEGLQASLSEVFVASQALAQLACHTSGLKAIKPATSNPNKESSLVPVKIFCIHLPLFTPLVLLYVRSAINAMDMICAALMVKFFGCPQSFTPV